MGRVGSEGFIFTHQINIFSPIIVWFGKLSLIKPFCSSSPWLGFVRPPPPMVTGLIKNIFVNVYDFSEIKLNFFNVFKILRAVFRLIQICMILNMYV